MQLAFTVLDPASGDDRATTGADVVVDAEPGGQLSEVSASLHAVLDTSGPAYVDGVLVGPDSALGAPPLLRGVVLCAGAPGVQPRARGAVRLLVTGGPFAGAVHHLNPGTYLLGRSPGADITVDDPDVSRAHAELYLGWDAVTVRDLGSTNGSLVDGCPAGADPVPWPLDSTLRVGSSTMICTSADTLAAPTTPDLRGRLDFNRPPRLLAARPVAEVRLPVPPVQRDRQRLPLIALVAPLLMAVVMLAVLRQPAFLLFALLSPVLVLGQWAGDRRTATRQRTGAEATYQHDLAAAGERIAGLVKQQREHVQVSCPDAATISLIASGPESRLWLRRPSDPDFLVVRLGTGTVPATFRVRASPDVSDPPEQPSVDDCPVTLDLRKHAVVGLAGEPVTVRALSRSVVGQLVTLHSPRHLRLMVLSTVAERGLWDWSRWLPHAEAAAGAGGLGLDAAAAAVRLHELLGELTRRQARLKRHEPQGPAVVVVVDGARALREAPGMARLLAQGPAVGIHLLCLDADELDLPAECQAVVRCGGPVGTSLSLAAQDEAPIDDATLDAVSGGWADRLARALAPLRDATPDDTATMPASVQLSTLLGAAPLDARALAERWRQAPASTRALIGRSATADVSVDLVRDGPHLLVGGTTGSGKSELLQTLVASLAVVNRPDELCFLLVDYKGGAAFAECARLPHTVGMVTDLDEQLTARALASLAAEVARRERLLAAAGASDLAAYREACDQRLPRLVIVVDEFATLVEELPEFVRGLVNVAQRGRSLGVHLVLATQRPSGVVSADIRANIGLRIALRVADASESMDILDCREAASISAATPGRALLRRGSEEPTLFQTALVSGASDGGPCRPRVRLLDRGPLAAVSGGDAAPDGVTPAASDLVRLAQQLSAAAELCGAQRAMSPWLQPLPDDVGESLVGLDDGAHNRGLVFGLLDEPRLQRRRSAVLELAEGGHLLVVGAPRTGRTTTLLTLAASAAASSRAVHVYAIDGGNGALRALEQSSQVGAVVDAADGSRVDRLLRRLLAELRRRSERDVSPGPWGTDRADPALLLLVDHWETLAQQSYDADGGRLIDQLLQLMREGPALGLSVAVTADRTALVGRLPGLCDRKVVLRMSDAGDYALAGLTARAIPGRFPPGRGVLVRHGTADDGLEVQVARLPASARPGSGPSPFRVDAVPGDASFAELVTPGADGARLVAALGLGGDEVGTVAVDLVADGPAFLVVGARRSGRSTALHTLGRSLLAGGARVLVVAPRASPLLELAAEPGASRLDHTVDAEIFTKALDEPGPFAILVDDVEALSGTSAERALEDHLVTATARGHAVIAAAETSMQHGSFRGLGHALRSHRTGLVLSPESVLDGELLGTRLPRTLVGRGPAGRGVLITGGKVLELQVAR